MKANYLIFVILTLFVTSLYSAGITFSFSNPIVTGIHPNSYYELDVMIQADEDNTYLKDTQLYIIYNTAGFGDNIGDTPSLSIVKGEALNTIGYSIESVANTYTDMFSVTISYISLTNATFSKLVPYVTAVDLLHLKMLIDDPNESAGLSFSFGSPTMENQQYYFPDNSDNTSQQIYSPVYGSDTSDAPLPVTLSTFSGVQDGDCVQLNWVTQSESNNWLWNVYRSDTSDLNNSFQHNGMPIWGAGTISTPTQYSYLDDEIENIPVITYYYWLESVDYNGEAELFGPISLNYFQNEESITAPELKKESMLLNYPNPFNPSTNIGIIAAEDMEADLIIYNSKGQLIDTIFKNKNLEKDVYGAFYWDGKSSSGNELPNGIYFAKLAYGDKVRTHRMILLK